MPSVACDRSNAICKTYWETTSASYKKRDMGIGGITHLFFQYVFDSVKDFFDPSSSIALDLGCGAGRNFCFVRNIDKLVGLDISQALLEEAKTPRREDLVSINTIELRQTDLLRFENWGTDYDLIYCIGVLSVVLPVKESILRQVHKRLKPGGIFIFGYLMNPSFFKRRMKIAVRSIQRLLVSPDQKPTVDHALRLDKFQVRNQRRITRLLARVGFRNIGVYNHPTKDWKVAVLQKAA